MKRALHLTAFFAVFLSLALAAKAFEICYESAISAEMKAKAACDASCLGGCTCRASNYCISLEKGACDASCSASKNCLPCYQVSECECNGIKINVRPFPLNACKQEPKCYTRSACLGENCEKESDVWLYDSCNGWLYELNDCSALNQTGQCSDWKCLTQGRIKTKKAKFRIDQEGYCKDANCETRKVTKVCEEFECEYGCVETNGIGNCYPKAVLKTIPAAIGQNVEVKEGQSVVFDCSESHDPDGSDITCKWDFGGSSATGTVVTKTFNREGSYKVNLTVTDSQGLNDSKDVIVNVISHDWPPTACFTVTPSEGIVGITEFQFDASCSSDPDIGLGDYVTSYEWDFGDGTIANGMRVKHVYTKKPIKDEVRFKVKLTVRDKGVAQASLSAMLVKEVVVRNNPPRAIFKAEPNHGKAPLTVSFKVLESDRDGHSVNYEWDFGDGTKATGNETLHTYKELGEYTVNLNATDEYGASSTSTATINVYSTRALTSLNAQTITKGDTSTVFVDCTGSETADVIISKGERSTIMSNIRCGTHVDYGPLYEEGEYNVIAQIPNCSEPACIKATAFSVVPQPIKKKSAPEISPVAAALAAFAALLIARKKIYKK